MSSRRPRAPRRILVGTGETAGYCRELVAGFREIGVHADQLDLAADPLSYGTGRAPVRVRVARWLERRRRRGPGPRAAWRLLHRGAMVLLLVHALLRYDTFVLRAGDSFLGLRDLRLLRATGKRLVIVFFGSDSRPSYLNGGEVGRGITGAASAAQTAAKRRIVEQSERYATAIVCHVMSAHLHRRPVIAFLAIGIPRAAARTAGAVGAAADRPVRVLHAPSRTQDKGTDVVRAAVARARASGADVELEVVTGRPNREVLAALQSCDFVIDQVYGDTPMGGFAAEAAVFGRPAIVGGYGWEELRRVTDPDALPPSHLCHPDELSDAIVRLTVDHAYRTSLGDRARRHVLERWNPAAVARRFVTVIEGEVPEAWWFDPTEVAYTQGVGMSEAAAAASVRGVIDAAGRDALAVQDKPALERRLVQFAGVGPSDPGVVTPA